MKTVLKYYRKYWYLIIISLCFLAGEAICELQLPSYMSGLLENGVGASDMAVIWSYGWKMILFERDGLRLRRNGRIFVPL